MLLDLIRRFFFLIVFFLNQFNWSFLAWFLNFKLESELKARAFAIVRGKRYFAVEFLHDLLGDSETKTYTIDVKLLAILYEAEQFKEFMMILLRNPNTCVRYWNFQELLIMLHLHNFDQSLNLAFLCEFEGIRL